MIFVVAHDDRKILGDSLVLRMRYLAQDILCNGQDQFNMMLQSDMLPAQIVQDVNDSMRIEVVETGVLASTQNVDVEPSVAVLVHCKCKLGEPSDSLRVHFENSTSLQILWPGVRRIFVRVRIMETTTVEILTDMLLDDIRSRHSISDVENPDIDQSFRPWSDQDDSETDTVDEDE